MEGAGRRSGCPETPTRTPAQGVFCVSRGSSARLVLKLIFPVVNSYAEESQNKEMFFPFGFSFPSGIFKIHQLLPSPLPWALTSAYMCFYHLSFGSSVTVKGLMCFWLLEVDVFGFCFRCKSHFC